MILMALSMFSQTILFAQQPPSESNDLPKISVKGNQFVTPDGKTFVFRGFNIAEPERLFTAGNFNTALFQELKTWGANVVRFPIHPTAWRKQGKANYLRILNDGIMLAREQGIYVIIDWHSIGNLRTEMYQADMYETTQKETFEFWRIISQSFKNNNTVAFFEIFNEPTIQNGQLGTCSWKDWKALNEEIIGIMRSNGATAIPLVAGFNWAYELSNIATEPINAEGIAYVSHPYPQKRPKPWEEKWTKDWGYVKDKYPLILTEIGFCGSEEIGAHIPVISDESYGDTLLKYCDDRQISYVAWVFDDRWAPRMFTDWTFQKLTRQGAYFKKAFQERTKNK